MSGGSREPAREVTVTHLGRFGDGVIEGAGAPVYVRGALPGEVVRIGRAAKDGKILRAPLLEVLSRSEVRVEPTCSVLARCGGCPLGHASRAWQADRKRGWLEEALRAQGIDVDAVAIELVLPEPARGYRTRARLAWDARRSRGHLGYREARDATVVVPERCEILVPALELARRTLDERVGPHLAGTGEVHLALSSSPDGTTEAVVARVSSSDPQPPALYAALDALVRSGSLAGASLLVGGAGVATTYGEPVERSRDVDGRALLADVGAFRQAHVAAAHELGTRVLRGARPEREHVLELYAGHGHFTLALAARAASMLAVELDPSAVRALRANAAAHGLGLDARAEDAAASLDTIEREVRAKKRSRPSVVVLDPPRAGAAECVPGLAALGPSRLVYVSCDAATLARDAGRLAATGLTLREVAVVDLFPDTLHVELVARFER